LKILIMNNLFKYEFEKLNPNEIKEIINRCAGCDILEINAIEDFSQNNYDNKYFIKYIKDDRYGFWDIEWGWKRAEGTPISTGTGFFQHRIKIAPFKVEFDVKSSVFAKHNKKKQLQDYMFIYINKKCKHYKQAIIEETERFINFLDATNTKEK